MGEIVKDLQADLVSQILMKAIVTLLDFFFFFFFLQPGSLQCSHYKLRAEFRTVPSSRGLQPCLAGQSSNAKSMSTDIIQSCKARLSMEALPYYILESYLALNQVIHHNTSTRNSNETVRLICLMGSSGRI